MQFVASTLSVLPVVFPIVALLASAICLCPHGVVFTVFYVFVWFSASFIKKFFSWILPTNVKSRPCKLEGKDCSCGFFGCLKTGTDEAAFPSTHAFLSGFFATFWTCYLSTIKQDWKTALGIAAIWLCALAIATERVATRCHSIPQVIVGLVLGTIYGVSYYMFGAFLFPNTFPKLFNK